MPTSTHALTHRLLALIALIGASACESSGNPSLDADLPDSELSDAGMDVSMIDMPPDMAADMDAPDTPSDAPEEDMGGGSSEFVPGAPIEVSAEELGQWVWIDMPQMRCSDGTEGGFAVNFTDASRDLVIYLQGGGICYNALTCTLGGAPSTVGDDPLNTALDSSIRDHRGIFDREDPSNPLRESNFVVLPHCTGDHHTGNRLTTYGSEQVFHHVGYSNITRMLERVVPTFEDASRVVLSGFSAGGVGITANYHQMASAFESVGQGPPLLVIDAGPFMRPPTLTEAARDDLRESWGLDETIGTFCPDCITEGFHEMYRTNQELHPGLQASLVCAYEDSVVRLLYGVLNSSSLSGSAMHDAMIDLSDWTQEIAPTLTPSRMEVFYYAGDRHGALNVAALSATPGLAEFLQGQLGLGEWRSVRP